MLDVSIVWINHLLISIVLNIVLQYIILKPKY